MSKLNVAIIGRGLGGLTLAFRMLDAGLQPTIFGSPRGPSNASRCAQGIVCNKGLIFAESPLFRAKLQTLTRLEAWLSRIEAAAGMTIPRLAQGVYEPYWTPADFQKTVKRVYRGNFWGCYRPCNLPTQNWPFEYRKPEGYLHYPDDAWFDVDATLDALEKACEKSGARLVEKPIQDLRELFAFFDHVVVAAGSGTVDLLKSLGLVVPKVFLVSGQSLVCRGGASASPQILVKGTLSLAVLGDRQILGSSSFKPEDGQPAELLRDQSELLRQAEEAFGLLQGPDSEIRGQWGTRLRFADRMPALGLWPEPALGQKLSVLSGFYKNGLQLADVCAEQLLRELQGDSLDEFGKAFHVSRFFSGCMSSSPFPGRPPLPKTQSPR